MAETEEKLVGDGSTFELEGLMFKVTVERDQDMREPWKEHDGHGVVSEWTTRDKKPGEKVLVHDGPNYRFYDVDATTKKAIRESWGVQNSEGLTKRQITAKAVEQDFERMQAWCLDEWWWVEVVVQLCDVDGEVIDRPDCRDSVWGTESDDAEHIDELAKELAGEIVEKFKGQNFIAIMIRKAE